jgi:hypothetical protein
MTPEEYEKRIKELEYQLDYAEHKLTKLSGITNGMTYWGSGLADDEKSEADRNACRSMFRSLADEFLRGKEWYTPKAKSSLRDSIYPSGRYHGD